MAGLPGTGKTTLAHALAERLNGVVLSKDEVRAALFPEHLVDYSVEQDDLCMEAITRAAQYLATHHEPPFIFFDGRTFSHTYQIDQVVAAADQCRARWKILHLWCPEEIARRRLEKGGVENHLAKNRDFNLYLELKSRFEPIARPKLEVDTSQNLEDSLEQCLAYLKSRTTPEG